MECKQVCKTLSTLSCQKELPLCTIDGQQYTPYAMCGGSGWMPQTLHFEKGYETKTCANIGASKAPSTEGFEGDGGIAKFPPSP